MSIFEDLQQGSVTRAQGRLLRELYPATMEELGMQIQTALIELKAARASYQLEWRREKLLAALFGVPLAGGGLQASLQASFGKGAGQEPQPGGNAPRGLDIDVSAVQTQAQRLAAR